MRALSPPADLFAEIHELITARSARITPGNSGGWSTCWPRVLSEANLRSLHSRDDRAAVDARYEQGGELPLDACHSNGAGMAANLPVVRSRTRRATSSVCGFGAPAASAAA